MKTFASLALRLHALGRIPHEGLTRRLLFTPHPFIPTIVYNAAAIPLLFDKRSMSVLWLNLSALLPNLTLNWLLTPRLGILGAALTSCASLASLAPARRWVAHRSTRTHFESGRLARTLSIAVVIACATLVFDRAQLAVHEWATLTAKTARLGFGWLAMWLLVLSAQERRQLRLWIGAKWCVGDKA